MLRTLRLNEEMFSKSVRSQQKSAEINPWRLLEIIQGKNTHENVEFAPEMRALFKMNYFRHYMTQLRTKRENMKSTCSMLLTGVWAVS